MEMIKDPGALHTKAQTERVSDISSTILAFSVTINN
jgi:hypothetical protein